MNRLSALIVDDELPARECLAGLLTQYFDVDILHAAPSSAEALVFLASESPDVIFLDIQMPGMSGIELARKISKRNILIVFVTAFDEFAVEAFKLSAVDYILKPTTIQGLERCLEKVRNNLLYKSRIAELNRNAFRLFEKLQSSNEENRYITVPWENGVRIINLSDLICVKSDNSYSELVLKNQDIVISKSIGELEKSLTNKGFYRIHNRYLINLSYMDFFSLKDGGTVTLKNKMNMPISRRRLVGFRSYMNSYFDE